MPLTNGQEPEATESPRAADENAESAEEWLVPQAGRVPESRKATKTQMKEASGEPPLATESAPADRSELAKAELLLKRQAKEIEALRRRVAEAEEQTERRAEAADMRAQNPGQLAEKLTEPPPPPPAPPANGQRLDINVVRFEDLRGLGLSVTQSARLIATRDVRMGFGSLKELDDVPDLPTEVIETLKQRLRV